MSIDQQSAGASADLDNQFDQDTPSIDPKVDADPLPSQLRAGMKLTIAFDDLSIPLPPMRAPDIRQRIIEQVLTMAADAGVDDVQIIAANALHRRMTAAEIKHIVGERVSLDRLARETLGAGKSGDGMQSLAWYREGRFDLIEEYCRRGVELLRDLYLFGRREGYVLFRDDQDRMMRVPVDWP